MHVPLPGLFQRIHEGWIMENRPMTEIDAETEIMMQLPEQHLELGRFKRKKQELHIFVSLEIRQATNFKKSVCTTCTWKVQVVV